MAGNADEAGDALLSFAAAALGASPQAGGSVADLVESAAAAARAHGTVADVAFGALTAGRAGSARSEPDASVPIVVGGSAVATLDAWFVADGVRSAAAAHLDSVARLLGAAVGRWEAESELLASERQLAEAQHHTHVGSFEWDIASNRIRWSDELYRIFGADAQTFDATFDGFMSRVHPDDRAAVLEAVHGACTEGREYRIEERIVRPDGEVRTLASWGAVVVGASGEPEKVIGSCQDVTDMRRAVSEVEVSEATLRTVFDTAPDAILVLDNFDRVVDANRAATGLFGRPRGAIVGLPYGELVAADGHQLAARRPRGESAPVEVRTAQIDTASGPARTAFVRDISNRIIAEQAEIELSTARLRRDQALELNDNVVQGLAAAAYALEMRQFPQAAGAVKQTLAATRTMINGLLEVAEEALTPARLRRDTPDVEPRDASGDGAAGTAEGEGGEAPGRAFVPRGPDDPIRVVIVDDSEDMRFLMYMALDPRHGFWVVGEAGDGLQAIDVVRQQQPDVVVLDLAMPRMDGLQAIGRIRHDAPSTAIVVLSGFDAATGQRALDLGAARYVEKGRVDMDLARIVRDVVAAEEAKRPGSDSMTGARR